MAGCVGELGSGKDSIWSIFFLNYLYFLQSSLSNFRSCCVCVCVCVLKKGEKDWKIPVNTKSGSLLWCWQASLWCSAITS